MAFDLGLNEDLDVYVTGRGDFAFVEGREAFEQDLALRLTAAYNELLGDADRPTIRDKLHVEAKRVHRQMDELDSLASIQIEFEEQGEEENVTVIVEIVYDTGDSIDFTVS